MIHAEEPSDATNVLTQRKRTPGNGHTIRGAFLADRCFTPNQLGVGLDDAAFLLDDADAALLGVVGEFGSMRPEVHR